MAVHVEVEVEIGRPVDEVFAFLADARNLPKWAGDFESVEQLSSGAAGLGTTYRYRGSRPAVSSELRWSEFVRDHRLAWDGRPAGSGGTTLSGSFQLEAIPGGTWLHGTFTPEGGLLARFAGSLIARSLRERRTRDFARLKELLERGGDSAEAESSSATSA